MIDKLNPTTVHEPAGYNHVTISNVGRLAHLAGQCPLDRSGEVVGKPGDYAAQTKQVITNCLAVLEAAGATPADVVRSVIYVASPDSDVLSAVWRQLTTSTPGSPPRHPRSSHWRAEMRETRTSGSGRGPSKRVCPAGTSPAAYRCP
jgi:enamine deaminase RidA (YjgF/YER057c/UK114 family)